MGRIMENKKCLKTGWWYTYPSEKYELQYIYIFHVYTYSNFPSCFWTFYTYSVCLYIYVYDRVCITACFLGRNADRIESSHSWEGKKSSTWPVSTEITSKFQAGTSTAAVLVDGGLISDMMGMQRGIPSMYD